MDFISNAKNKIEKFPIYRRAPRVIMEPPTDSVEIAKMPSASKMDKGSLIQIIITPLSMLLVTILMGIFANRKWYMMLGILGTIVSSIFSIVQYFSRKKECQENNKKREDVYSEYLLDKRKEIYENYLKEIKCYLYNSPRLEVIEKMVNGASSRIYEKSAHDADFLALTVGYYKSETSTKIKYSQNDIALETEELEDEVKEIIKEFSEIDYKPLLVDLLLTNLGLVGNKDIIHEQLHVLIAKLCFEISYLDMEIVLFIDENDWNEFRYLQWYPHFQIEALGSSGLIYNGDVADQILLSMHKIIKMRELESESNNKKDIKYNPHFVFIIDDESLVQNHVIMEYFSKNINYGYSLIYTSSIQDSLPENIQTVIKYKNKDQGILVINNRILENKLFYLDRIGDVKTEWLARNLSTLVHEQGRVMHLPETVSFLEMYKAKDVFGLNIPELWEKSRTNKSLAVPIGIRATGEMMMLNLHEKAHGPHGLIAGTTGSGKSEIIQTYILSLAVNYHPYDVGFLLIDYKGGGMANLFKNLPHVLGTITNLDASDAMRALASIKGELSRRQKIFAENSVNHINDYAKLFKENKVAEPLPHLFIISDEFAELKKEQPDFMKELVSTARLGRSLGIHLILATQKPSGVVTDQIWSNSRFKLALKVQDEGDSKEIIKTPDAAYIKNPGRAYLQVGNNEIYELFQSAYSGADCLVEEKNEIVDNRVYIRNYLGQMELINEDLDARSTGNNTKTQLEAIVDYIDKLYNTMNCKDVSKPWLPPLPEQIISNFVEDKMNILRQDENCDIYSDVEQADLSVELGVIDNPNNQTQEIETFDFREMGNLVVVGAAGYGKSTLIKTILFSLALKSPASLLNYYIIDFGNGSLLPFKNLPQCADYMSYDDIEKITRFIQLMSDEIKYRKKKLSEASAMNIDMYNRGVNEKIPNIILTIDNYDVAKEIAVDFDTFINQLSREGNNIGIYIILSASRPMAIRSNILNNFKTKLSLFMYDSSDIRVFVGKCEWGVKDIKGRVYIKKDEVYEMQIYTTHDMIKDDVYVENLKNDIQILKNHYKGKCPRKISVMPKELTNDIFNRYIIDKKSEEPSIADNLCLIPVGLNVNDVSVAFFDITNKLQLIIGGPLSGKTNFMKVVLKNKHSALKTYVIDDKMLELKTISHEVGAIHITSREDYMQFLSEMQSIVDERHRKYEEEKLQNPSLIPGDFYSKMEPVLILIADLEVFTGNIGILNDLKIWRMIMNLEEVNVTIVASVLASKLKGIDELTKAMKQSVYGIVTGSASAQMQFTIPRAMTVNEKVGIGYKVERGRPEQILIPLL